MLLTDQLRQAIAPAHAAIERTPLAAAMFSGTVTRDQYAFWLAQMYHLHSAVERLFAECHELAGIYDPTTMERADLLERDAEALGIDLNDDGPCPAIQTLINAAGAPGPKWNLIGVLYVLEGSRMGSLALAPRLARALDVPMRPGSGLDYHLDGAADRMKNWPALRGRIAKLPIRPEDEADAVTAAVVTMSLLAELYEMPVPEMAA